MNTYKAKTLFKEQHGHSMIFGDHFDLTKLTEPYELVCYKHDSKEFYTLDMETELWNKTAEKIYKNKKF